MKTREKILQAALEMFNEQGTAVVSTNHIADKMGISPGNLYYHFRNKGEIIGELVERYVGYFDSFYTSLVAGDSPEEVIRLLPEKLNASMLHSWNYRFYLREISSLFQQYPDLKENYRKVRVKREDPFFLIMEKMQDMGLLKLPERKNEIKSLNRSIWLISHFWISMLDMEKEHPTAEDMKESSEVLMDLFRPYLTEDAEKILEKSHES